MPRVDDRRGLFPQVDTRELPGHEPAPAGEVVKPGIGQARLLAEPHPGPTRVAERADEHGGEDCGADLVAHGVGHREMKRVAFHREVERVPTYVTGRLQPGRKRELPRL